MILEWTLPLIQPHLISVILWPMMLHTDLLFLNLAKLIPTLRLLHLLLPLFGRLLPLIFHMSGSFLSFKSQLKCHLRMTFPNHSFQNSHSVTCHLVSNHCLFLLFHLLLCDIFLGCLFAYVLSLFFFPSLPPSLPFPSLPPAPKGKSQESRNYVSLVTSYGSCI